MRTRCDDPLEMLDERRRVAGSALSHGSRVSMDLGVSRSEYRVELNISV